MSQSMHVSGGVVVSIGFLLCIGSGGAFARQLSTACPADRRLAEYFRAETAKLQERCLSDIRTLDDWKARRDEYRGQLLEMLGLDPLPERTPLMPEVTGTVEHDGFTVEKLHFQSMPGLYVTANLYIPRELDKPAPAILYVCGHGRVAKDGVSFGNKVAYQHHGEWFARHGYACLTIDTLQLGEIEGIHHGTHRYNMWWWNSRGYTAAGVEAWNCVRALDYLQTRKEVDVNRIGVTGRSGGGAYSWWIAAIDERIKAAVPVAGITDLQNHVVDGCVEGHCDCMFIVNTYRWDYPLVAALVAPRPLLISNSDKDSIFPLDGVLRVHEKVRRIYRLYGRESNLGLHITEGPHKDTQELRIHAFVWFNRFLKDENPLIDDPAAPVFEPWQLKVFQKLPADQVNTKIHETFVRQASCPPVPQSANQWIAMRDGWMTALREKVFRGWPSEEQAGPLDIEEVFCAEKDGIRLTVCEFTSQPNVRLRISCVEGLSRSEGITLHVLDETGWTRWLAAMRGAFEEYLSEYRLPDADPAAFGALRGAVDAGNGVLAYMCPRGIGPDVWTADERKQVQIRRRFMLLGQTVDGMRAWDVRRAMAAVQQLDGLADLPVTVRAHDDMAGMALYASLFETGATRLDLIGLPPTHAQGPVFLNVLRCLDTPQAVAMAAERTTIRLHDNTATAWQFPASVLTALNWNRQRFSVEATESQPSQ